MSRLDFLREELRRVDEQGLRRQLRLVSTPQRPRIILDGRPVINFASNNYLGLADSPALVEAAHRALDEFGFGAGAARLISGHMQPHEQLESALAAFHETESALTFTSGYQANVGLLSALAGPDDVIFSDALNHASLIDGCRLSRARVVVYRHCDVRQLADLLAAESGRRRFIVTDSLFSMDGDVAPLRALAQLAEHHQAILVVDEAHATGILGPQGRGLVADAGVRADVHLATLSKAFGSFGAYCTGSKILTDALLHRARSFVFTTALPPAVSAASIAALSIIRSPEGDARRKALQARVDQFARGLVALGLRHDIAGATAIFPIVIGDAAATMSVTAALLERGIYAQGIRPPTVPVNTARLRFALSATHTPDDVDAALNALDDLRRARLLPRSTHG